jgi:hypothetical protein
MWVFRNDAFVSAVQHRDNADHLMVRARVSGDLERFFGWPLGSDRVATTPEADYLFRTVVSREEMCEALICSVDGIVYANFKDSIPKTKKGNLRHDFYMRVWNAMMAYQRRLRPRSGYWWPGSAGEKGG